MLILSIIVVFLFCLVLIRSTDLLTDHIKELAWKTALGEFAITSILIGLATSLPEISVGITSALGGVPNISLGNAIGSNIANLSLITGLATLISGALFVRDETYTADFTYGLFAGIAPILLLVDGELSRVDGLLLLALYGYYSYSLLQKRNKEQDGDDGFWTGLVHKIRQNHTARNFKFIFFSLVLIIFSADMIVRIGQYIATELGVPVFLIGLFLVAIGTSLPELAFGIRSIKKHEPQLFMGNLLGSTVANTTLIVGITSLIHPITPVSVSEYVVAMIMFTAIVFTFMAFFRSRHRINRLEGLLLISIYLLFFILEAYQHVF